MIPILYGPDEVAFASNGLGRLRDCISCVVTEERNGIYECDFEYPINGANFNEIRPGCIIAAKHDQSADVQPFDIVSYSKPVDGVVTFHAVHISYRQSYITASGSGINSLSLALGLVKNNAVPENPFVYWTDKTSTGYMAAADNIPRTVRSLLGGEEGSILDTYGGEYEWDKFIVRLWGSRGKDRDLTIRYGVSMVDFNEDLDYSESYSAVIPYWTGETDAGASIVVKGDKVKYAEVAYNGRELCVPLDLTDRFESQPTAEQLEAEALSNATASHPMLPMQNIDIDFISLQDTPEYEQYASLSECKLCDTINVVLPRYGVEGRIKIVKTEYDVLQERFVGMELGTLSTTLAQALGI